MADNLDFGPIYDVIIYIVEKFIHGTRKFLTDFPFLRGPLGFSSCQKLPISKVLPNIEFQETNRVYCQLLYLKYHKVPLCHYVDTFDGKTARDSALLKQTACQIMPVIALNKIEVNITFIKTEVLLKINDSCTTLPFLLLQGLANQDPVHTSHSWWLSTENRILGLKIKSRSSVFGRFKHIFKCIK